jgi:replication factor C subunit 3/5
MLFYGPPSSGKKTRIFCVLRELYGNGVDKLKIEREEFETPSKKRMLLKLKIKRIFSF